ncbi:PLD nuclease N-terminal domain-containing protein, partial [Actinomadura adrarensis]
MTYFYGIVTLFILGLWIFCLLDVITTDEALCRHLPKMLWVLIVLLLPTIGSLLWLIAGRPAAPATSGMPYKGNTGRYPEYDRPGRFAATNPDDDEEFLRRCRE